MSFYYRKRRLRVCKDVHSPLPGLSTSRISSSHERRTAEKDQQQNKVQCVREVDRLRVRTPVSPDQNLLDSNAWICALFGGSPSLEPECHQHQPSGASPAPPAGRGTASWDAPLCLEIKMKGEERHAAAMWCRGRKAKTLLRCGLGGKARKKKLLSEKWNVAIQ